MIHGAIKKTNLLLGVTEFYSEQNQDILLIYWNMVLENFNMEGQYNKTKLKYNISLKNY
jgi:hypothetical protein